MNVLSLPVRKGENWIRTLERFTTKTSISNKEAENMCGKLALTELIMPRVLNFMSRLRQSSHYKNRAKVDSKLKSEIEFWKQVMKKATKGVTTHTLQKWKNTLIMSRDSSFKGIDGLFSSGVFCQLHFDTEG